MRGRRQPPPSTHYAGIIAPQSMPKVRAAVAALAALLIISAALPVTFMHVAHRLDHGKHSLVQSRSAQQTAGIVSAREGDGGISSDSDVDKETEAELKKLEENPRDHNSIYGHIVNKAEKGDGGGGRDSGGMREGGGTDDGGSDKETDKSASESGVTVKDAVVDDLSGTTLGVYNDFGNSRADRAEAEEGRARIKPRLTWPPGKELEPHLKAMMKDDHNLNVKRVKAVVVVDNGDGTVGPLENYTFTDSGPNFGAGVSEKKASDSKGWWVGDPRIGQQVKMPKGLRDFDKEPVRVSTGFGWTSKDDKKCMGMPCSFGHQLEGKGEQKFDLSIRQMSRSNIPGVLNAVLSQESIVNYPFMDYNTSHAAGVDIVMTTMLDSDVPVPYFSYVEYDFFQPVREKTEPNAVCVFISAGSNNNRDFIVQGLFDTGMRIDSYGARFHNRNGAEKGARKSKGDVMSKYKFYLAFENTCEKDYVTEKFYGSLASGSVPVVFGAPDIHHFAPDKHSIIDVKDFNSTEELATYLTYLATHEEEYNKYLRWKQEGPSEEWLALLDLSSVHSFCRACVKAADILHGHPNGTSLSPSGEPFWVRERSLMHYRYFAVREPTVASLHQGILEAFPKDYKPVWVPERRGFFGTLRIFSVYPAGIFSQEGLWGDIRLDTDEEVAAWLEAPTKLEVIFI